MRDLVISAPGAAGTVELRGKMRTRPVEGVGAVDAQNTSTSSLETKERFPRPSTRASTSCELNAKNENGNLSTKPG